MRNTRCFTALLMICIITAVSCSGQHPTQPLTSLRIVGGPCEGCDGLLEYGAKLLKPTDTLPLFETINDPLKITGTVFRKDGITPAEGVILYIYHTNRSGIYQTRGNEKGWAKRHGFIRGWIKTGSDGKYSFYTFRPAAYPDNSEPEHIHLTVKEPGTNTYYLDDYLFEDDPLLSTAVRKRQAARGGSGIVKPVRENGMLLIRRDIILGLNIPDYE